MVAQIKWQRRYLSEPYFAIVPSKYKTSKKQETRKTCAVLNPIGAFSDINPFLKITSAKVEHVCCSAIQ